MGMTEKPEEALEKTPEITAEEQEPAPDAKKKKKRRGNKLLRAALGVIMIAILGIFACVVWMGVSVGNSNSPVGIWEVKKISAYGNNMTEQDAENMGLDGIGYIRLNSNGSCSVKILDLEGEGTWSQSEDGAVTIDYGSGQPFVAHINDEGIMTITDEVSVEYKLEK